MRLYMGCLLAAAVLACSEGGGDRSAGTATVSDAMMSAQPASAPPEMQTRGGPEKEGADGSLGNTATASVVQGRVLADTGTSGAPVMIIRTGHASIEVADVDEAAGKVRALATSFGGHVANSSFQGGEHNVRSATLELKIPAARYDDAVAALASLGEVESVNSSSEDVGEEYVDVTARVANARRLEQRLIQLLATRTGKLEDVLAVERELARVREAIERAEGRLRYLRTRASMSTLTVVVHENEPILGRGADNPIVAAFKEAWRNFVRFIAWLIASLGVLIPVAAMAGIGYVLWRKFRRTR